MAMTALLSMILARIAALYAATGVSIAIAAGWTLGRFPLERWIEPWVLATRASHVDPARATSTAGPAKLRAHRGTGAFRR